MQKTKFSISPIGVIRTPYHDLAPHQSNENDENIFFVELDEEYVEGMENLEEFEFIFLLYYLDRVTKKIEMKIKPPWAKGKEVGLFSSRSPVRPNPIGLSVVRIKKIKGNRIYTTGLDAFDGTPVIDIKPYIKNLDEKSNANYGWIDSLDGDDHLAMHIKGIPHTH